MANTIIGVFSDHNTANAAIDALRTKGFNPDDFSVILRDTSQLNEITEDVKPTVAEGAASGATTGGIIGALAGLLIGVGAIAIPGIGGLLIGGPIAAALGLGGAAASTVSGAVTGALAGGIVGALVNLGIPESEARIYEERIREGKILLAVHADDERTNEVQQVMNDNQAEKVDVTNLNINR